MFRKFFKQKRGDFIVPEAGFNVVNGIHYHEVIRRINKNFDPEHFYIEIGSRSGDSLREIKSNLVAVDPEFAINQLPLQNAKNYFFVQKTSDDFFLDPICDLIRGKSHFAFIDGMHLFEYSLRDFIGLEGLLNKGGIIAFHDVIPSSKAMTKRSTDRISKGLPWTGDVWKVIPILKEFRPDLKLELLDSRKTGLLLVSNLNPESDILKNNYEKIITNYFDLEIGEEEYGELQSMIMKASEYRLLK